MWVAVVLVRSAAAHASRHGWKEMKMKCPKCKHYVDDHDADCCTDIHCQCDNSAPEAQQAAELTALGVGLAALLVNDVVLLAVIMAVIGAR